MRISVEDNYDADIVISGDTTRESLIEMIEKFLIEHLAETDTVFLTCHSEHYSLVSSASAEFGIATILI